MTQTPKENYKQMKNNATNNKENSQRGELSPKKIYIIQVLLIN